jgi:HEAT repeat protein
LIKDVRTVEPLIAALMDKDEFVRSDASYALDEKGPLAVGPLVAALRESDSDVLRERVAGVLGRLKAARAGLKASPAVEPLIAALRDGYSRVRACAADALGEIKDSRAVEPLIAALRDSDGDARASAAAALGEIKDSRAVEPLIAALTDKNFRVSRCATDALARMKDPRVVEPLVRVLAARTQLDSSTEVLLDSLKALGWQPADARERALLAVHQEQWAKAASLGAAAVGPLIDAIRRLESREQRARELPAWNESALWGELERDRSMLPVAALLSITDPAAAEPLAAVLANEDAGPRVRRATAAALAGIEGYPLKDFDPEKPVCSICGKELRGLLPFAEGGEVVALSARTADEVLDDYAHFAGSFCLQCVAVFCADCLGERVDKCPRCQNEAQHAYRVHLRQLKEIAAQRALNSILSRETSKHTR